jgi:hypothetical protein
MAVVFQRSGRQAIRARQFGPKERPADKLYRLIKEAGLPLPEYADQRGLECVPCVWAGDITGCIVAEGGKLFCPECRKPIKRGKELVIAELSRQWRADMAWPSLGVLVEIHGAIWDTNRGKHVRPLGFTDNVEKRNAANLLGWRVYEFTAEHIDNGYAIALLRVSLDPASAERPATSNVRRFSRILTDLTHLKGTTAPRKKTQK